MTFPGPRASGTGSYNFPGTPTSSFMPKDSSAEPGPASRHAAPRSWNSRLLRAFLWLSGTALALAETGMTGAGLFNRRHQRFDEAA